MMILRTLFVTVLLLTSLASQARSLYWEELSVNATLRADGSLRVIERQQMIFDGDWNGGERDFYVGLRQQLRLLDVSRINPDTEARIRLHEGNLAAVDRYQLKNGRQLRWRSRLPSDPLFKHTRLIYELEYEYTNILAYDNGVFFLNHDFAFTRRSGEFKHYRLNIVLDSVWRAISPEFVNHIEQTNIPPGTSVVVKVQLEYSGEGWPAAVLHSVSLLWRVVILFVLMLFIIVYLLRWLRHEKNKGRFQSLLPVEQIDVSWLEQHVFSELPEHIGSLWDLQTDGAEVAAMLARLTQEEKIKSHVMQRGFWIFKKPVLHLELMIPRTEFATHERSLIKRLFPAGDKTDTVLLRKHYRAKGFDPAHYIRTRLLGHKLRGQYDAKRGKSRSFTPWLYLCAVILAVAVLVAEGEFGFIYLMAAGILAAPGAALFYFNGSRLQIEVEHPVRSLLKTLYAYTFLLVVFFWFVLSGVSSPSIWVYLMYSVIFAALLSLMFNTAWTNVSSTQVLRRKLLCSARRYFAEQLKRPHPVLRDEWYPYLIAFGLDKQMQKWFRAYADTTGNRSGIHNYSSSGGTGSSGSNWSGGGGSFGGAGATGAWTSAATAMASGVATPGSSSSGGGSSGGGGGGSGGGGGGGW